jgi:hypothetical protein
MFHPTLWRFIETAHSSNHGIRKTVRPLVWEG